MSTFDVKPPKITGLPGFTIWMNASTASASADCNANAPAMVIGRHGAGQT